MRLRSYLLLSGLGALGAACGPKDDGLAPPRSSSAPPPTTSAASAIPLLLDPDLPPSKCAVDVAPSVRGSARFERPAAGSTDWSIVLSLEPPKGGSYDAARAPGGFGSIGAPSASMDGGNIVVRARVKFTSDAFATFVVAVRCDGAGADGKDAGLLSAGVRWTDGDMEPGKTIEAIVGPFGGS